MVTLPAKHTAPPTIQCDCCSKPIHFEDLTLLQDEGAGLDDLNTYHLHAGCVDTFLTRQAGRWSRLPKTAIDHGWFWA
ncbi:MAG: hypothetical protein R2834_13655 [Rhodothermales bacterium]